MGPVAHLTRWFGTGQRGPKKRNRRDVGNVSGVPQERLIILGGRVGVLLPWPPRAQRCEQSAPSVVGYKAFSYESCFITQNRF